MKTFQLVVIAVSLAAWPAVAEEKTCPPGRGSLKEYCEKYWGHDSSRIDACMRNGMTTGNTTCLDLNRRPK